MITNCSNFKLTKISGPDLDPVFRATIDVTYKYGFMYMKEKTETMSIFRNCMDLNRWRFLESGEYTPAQVIFLESEFEDSQGKSLEEMRC